MTSRRIRSSFKEEPPDSSRYDWSRAAFLLGCEAEGQPVAVDIKELQGGAPASTPATPDATNPEPGFDDIRIPAEAAPVDEGAETAAPAAEGEPFPWDRIKDVDPEEIIRNHPGLQQHVQTLHGRAGELAQRQARQIFDAEKPLLEMQLRQQIETEMVARQQAAEDAALERTRVEDPIAYAQGVADLRSRRQAFAQRQAETARRAKEYSEFSAGLTTAQLRQIDEETITPLHTQLHALSPEAADALAKTPYAGGVSGRAQYIRDAQAKITELQVAQERNKHTKDQAAREAAIRKEVLAQANAGDNPDTGGGTAAPSDMTPGRYKQMPIEKRLEWRDQNPAAHRRMFEAG